MEEKPGLEKILLWSETHSMLMTGILLVNFFFENLTPLLIIAFGSFSYYAYMHRKYLIGLTPIGGYANWVTFIRFMMVCFATLFYQKLGLFYLFLIYTGAVLLDVVDGYLARRFNQMSDFGLYFDMESDAFFVAAIATVLYKLELLEFWILIPAYLRYFYQILLKLLPIQVKKEPKRAYASIIAGCFFVALLLPFVLPGYVYKSPLYLTGFLILISFAVSFRFQIQHQTLEDEEAYTKTFL